MKLAALVALVLSSSACGSSASAAQRRETLCGAAHAACAIVTEACRGR
jgi:hypothetical protein